ncbi:MAG TPA: GLPGLI family protein [Chryseosolibacter sp.]|nr:GLPGLI family protein [Chryseosolibacter sp.]
MTKMFAILAFLIGCATQNSSAQTAEGVINYEIKTNMHRNIPADRQRMKDMIPEFNIDEAQLFFRGDESYYKPIEVEPEPDLDSNPGPGMRMRRPKNETYLNQAESRIISLREFMGKKYLIEDTLRMRPWKIGTDTKEIAGYLCRKAIITDAERKMNVVAWFTDALRPFLGPENFNTLPGAVLQVDVNDGERILSAKQINLRPLEKNEIEIPKAKSKMTEDEYREMVNAQLERLRANGRNVIIRN